MISQDYFVGAVSVLLGGFALTGAVLNLDWYFRLKKAQRIEAWAGRRGARAFYAALGLSLIALGIAIACGIAPNKSVGRRLKQNAPADPHVPVYPGLIFAC